MNLELLVDSVTQLYKKKIKKQFNLTFLKLIYIFSTNYSAKCSSERSRLEELEALCENGLSGGAWSRWEKWTFQAVSDIYTRYTPEHLKSKVVALFSDMLTRLLPGRSRRDIFEMSSLDMRIRWGVVLSGTSDARAR